jgi:hypothetical protein
MVDICYFFFSILVKHEMTLRKREGIRIINILKKRNINDLYASKLLFISIPTHPVRFFLFISRIYIY